MTIPKAESYIGDNMVNNNGNLYSLEDLINDFYDTWKEYEAKPDFSQLPMDILRQIPKEVLAGKTYDKIDSVIVTNIGKNK